ncbi:hypothetical protein PCASD_24330 [Puccinia coronata f. sp. avenae]|uniref:Uncharacterized protein n=1 Tax=Puccinia coronata f. sp. avenae TaxID=200324 RepID=A0A2N5RYQ9_9BASI|nr:hypothetical protein PCASD_24330 [Puccinia coronata f. sp. avenae]
MDPQRLLAMFMPIINARNAEPEEPESRRRRHRRPRAPPRLAVPPLDPARNPILLDGRVQLPKPLFLTPQAKESAFADLRDQPDMHSALSTGGALHLLNSSLLSCPKLDPHGRAGDHSEETHMMRGGATEREELEWRSPSKYDLTFPFSLHSHIPIPFHS